MQSDELTPDQCEIMRDSIGRQKAYLFRLKQRMEAECFHPQDPLYRKTCRACDAVLDLWVDLHYRSCKSGVGRSSRTG